MSLLVLGFAVSMVACPSDDVAPPEPGSASGLLGGACDPSTRCEDLGGRSVACVGGRCELTDCAAGFLGCSCHPDASCEAVYDAAIACSARGMCEAEGCQAGERYCECGGGCAGGLSCVGGVCRASASTQRVFVSGAARACEFDVRASAPVDVVYGTGFVGRHAQRGDRLGVALASERNRAADGAVLHLVARGNETAIQLSSGRCVDGAGRALTDAGIRTE
ncbi:MAG: hypothetical protein AAF735_08045 [Myxococcota bacterium]